MNPVRVVASDKTEMAGYLSAWTGMQRHHYLSFRLKWANDISVCEELIDLLYAKCSEHAADEKWKIPKDRDYCQEFAEMAVIEFRSPYKLDTGEKRAEWIGLAKSSWYRSWSERYESLYQYLDDWSGIAFRAVRKNMAE